MRLPLTLIAVVALGGCRTSSTPTPSGATASTCQYETAGPGPQGTIPITVEVVAAGLQVPWSVAFLPDGDWLVSERTGSIRLFRAGKLLDQPVAKVDIAAGDEGGLLGIAADPAFASTRHLFVYATVRDGDRTVNRVLRYQVSGDGRTATMDRVLIDGIPAHRFHDGGACASVRTACCTWARATPAIRTAHRTRRACPGRYFG